MPALKVKSSFQGTALVLGTFNTASLSPREKHAGCSYFSTGGQRNSPRNGLNETEQRGKKKPLGAQTIIKVF